LHHPSLFLWRGRSSSRRCCRGSLLPSAPVCLQLTIWSRYVTSPPSRVHHTEVCIIIQGPSEGLIGQAYAALNTMLPIIFVSTFSSCLEHIDSICRAPLRPSSSPVSVFHALLRPPPSKTPLSLSQVTIMTLLLPVRLQSLDGMLKRRATKINVQCMESSTQCTIS
jgi:hypothetical protein